MGSLPFTSPYLGGPEKEKSPTEKNSGAPFPNLPKLAGIMSARGLLANPALFAGYEACPWEAVELFMNNVARAPLPLKLVQHHLGEMTAPGMGPNKNALLSKKERTQIYDCTNMCDLIDFMDEKIGGEGLRRDMLHMMP